MDGSIPEEFRPGPLLLDGILNTHKPDILDTISNLSNDEVFTPPRMANLVLDLLPPEIWSDPTIRILDPFCKTGVFLREAARRLIAGLAEVIPDEAERRAHIFKNQIYGVAITELTWLMSRRSLYGTKDASSDIAAHLTTRMDRPEGNIIFPHRTHDFDARGKCRVCGIGRDIERQGRDNHAYALIHGGLEEEFGDMQFDVIIGNPPYQVSVGQQTTTYAVPIYQKFIEDAKRLRPRFLSMIIPSRWFTGGRGLDDFRSGMLLDRHIRSLVDYPNSAECFSGVDIKGGVCYFLRDASHHGKCQVTTVVGDNRSCSARYLDEYGSDMFVRRSEYLPIIDKVKSKGLRSFAEMVGPQTPFGLYSSWTGEVNSFEGSLLVKRNGEDHFISRKDIRKGSDLVNRWKVLIPKAGDGGAKTPMQVIGKPIIAKPGEICTQTYLVVGPFDTEVEAQEVAAYMRTKFFRFLVSALKSTQDGMSKVYQLVPIISGVCASDEKLYKQFEITEDEQSFINSMIREM